MEHYEFNQMPYLHTIDDPLIVCALILLFTDKYVSDEELPYPMPENKGWYGDAVDLGISPEILGKDYSWGSRLWTLDRAKMNEVSQKNIKEIIEEALNPLLLLKLVDEFLINVSIKDSFLGFEVVFIKEKNQKSLKIKDLFGGQHAL